MSYVPIVPSAVVPPQPPSPRVRELAGLLTTVLEEYRKAHPSTTPAEIRSAIRMAAISTGPGRQARAALVLSVVVGVIVFLVGLGVFLSQAQTGGGSEYAVSSVVVGLTVLILLAVLLVKLRSQ